MQAGESSATVMLVEVRTFDSFNEYVSLPVAPLQHSVICQRLPVHPSLHPSMLIQVIVAAGPVT